MVNLSDLRHRNKATNEISAHFGDYKRTATTVLFHTELSFDKVSHLFPDGTLNEPVKIIDVKTLDPQVELLDTLFVLAVRKDALESLPEAIEFEIKSPDGKLENLVLKSFVGQHREVPRRLCGETPKYDCSHLSRFTIIVGEQQENLLHCRDPLNANESEDGRLFRSLSGSSHASDKEPP